MIPLRGAAAVAAVSFVVMQFLGYSLDNLSLLALTLAIGFLVDDAIVFLENCVRRMEQFHETPMEAAIAGAKEISFTILSMTLSLAAVFIPLVFMPGVLGLQFREFAVVIIVAIIASESGLAHTDTADVRATAGGPHRRGKTWMESKRQTR